MRIFYAEAPMHNWKIWRIFGILLCSVSSALFEQSTKNVKPYIPLQLCSAPPQVISKKLNFSQENQFFKTASQIAAYLFHNSNKWWIFNVDKEDMILVSVISTFFKTMLWKKSKRCILPVLRQKSTQKSQRGSAKCTCYSASKLSEKHKAQIFAPLNFFLHQHKRIDKNYALIKFLKLRILDKKRNFLSQNWTFDENLANHLFEFSR